jgi:hypothetical protein
MVDSGLVDMFSARSCVDNISSWRHVNQGATSFLPSLAFAGRPCVLAKSPLSFIRISPLPGNFFLFNARVSFMVVLILVFFILVLILSLIPFLYLYRVSSLLILGRCMLVYMLCYVINIDIEV